MVKFRKMNMFDVMSLDLKDAIDALAEMSGEITSADILDSMFSEFCVGK